MREHLASINDDFATSWGAWWMDAFLAVFVGFGTLQDHLRGAGTAKGWHVVPEAVLAIGGAVALVLFGWRAVVKFRVRGDRSPTP